MFNLSKFNKRLIHTEFPKKSIGKWCLCIAGFAVATSLTYIAWNDYKWGKMVEQDPSSILQMYFPSNTLVKLSVKNNPKLFKRIQPRCLMQELCDGIIHEHPELFEYVPTKFKTYQMCYDAVNYYPGFIKYVPDDKFDQELCNTVVYAHNWSFQYIPDRFKTVEMCELLLQNNMYPMIYLFPASVLTSKFLSGVLSNDKYLDDIKGRCIGRYINLKQDDIGKLKGNLYDHVQRNDPFENIPIDIIKQCSLSQFDNIVLTGVQFNKYFPNVTLTKVTNDSECHNGYKFKDGRNVDSKRFDHKSTCDNGIYFSDCPEKWGFMYGCHRHKCFQRSVTIPNDALVKIERNKIKASIVNLGPRSDFSS